MRVFIGIQFSQEFKKRIQEKVQIVQPLISKARFSDWQGYHLTLKFLGEIDQESLRVISSILKSTDFNVKPFDLRIGGLGFFRNRGGDILWADIINDEKLETVYKITESRMALAGFEPDQREFRPHLTIARAARLKVPLAELAGKWGESVLTEKIESIVLFESVRLNGILKYVPLMEKKL